MWLVLCASTDTSALWAYEGLNQRGLQPLELVTAEALAHAVRWEHRLGTNGVTLDVTLADGRRIRNQEVRGALNRLLSMPSEILLLIHPSDRDYVAQELNTFFLSWLYSLPGPMLNRPTPFGLSGQWRHASEWVYLAARAGLPAPFYRQSSRDLSQIFNADTRLAPAGATLNTVAVVAGRTVGASAPPHIHNGCRRLAQLSRTALLGVEFAVGPEGGWTFAGATTHPNLRAGGDALLDVLAHVLAGHAEGEL
jgi:hypothetical protein